MKTSYAYYPGCSALKSATELDLAARKVMDKLGITWNTLDQAACCGSRECGGLKVVDEPFAMANNSRTLAMAEEMGATTVLNVCSTCQLELEGDNTRLKNKPSLLKSVNGILDKIDLHYNGSLDVKNLLYVLIDDLGVDVIKKAVARPLKGFKFAPFYGCHLLRPSSLHKYREDPYNPRSLGLLIEALGGEEVKYDGATKCCGFHSILIKPKPSLEMSGGHLLEAKDNGADFIVTPCPLCHTVLDSYQLDIEKTLETKIQIPVLHLSQMVGLALGVKPEDLGMERHMIDPMPKLSTVFQFV